MDESGGAVDPGGSPEWVERRWGGSRVRAEPSALAWVDRAMREHGTLYDAARADHQLEAAGGRGPVFGVRHGGEAWMVRHCRRGGAFGEVLGDRYVAVSTPRPFREQTAARALRKAGVSTPAVVAAAVYPAGPIYRGDVMTTWVEGSASLLHRLAPIVSSRPESAVPLLRQTGGLARSLARAGAMHVDFNAGNVLLSDRKVWVIDLDRCRLGMPNGTAAVDRTCRRMLDRLARSLRKTVTGGAPLPPTWLAALADGGEVPT